jgi:hypothetical protein
VKRIVLVVVRIVLPIDTRALLEDSLMCFVNHYIFRECCPYYVCDTVVLLHFVWPMLNAYE